MDLQNKLKINAQEIEKEVKLILGNWKDEVIGEFISVSSWLQK